jgi:peptidoglycan L-alanyl-D-glutamate endopeptidase CwlK
MAKFDERSEKNIATLHPDAQAWAREFLRRVLASEIQVKIIAGLRTYEEQNALYAKGRTKPGSIVTKVKGGYSLHNFGIAWDIGVFNGSKYLEKSPLYDKAGEIGRNMGLEWGGDWKSFVDKPHFQCKTGKTLAQLRKLHESGQPISIPPVSGQPAGSSTDASSEIKVLINGTAANIPARLISDHTWVGVRAFVGALGGSVDAAGGNPFRVTVSLNGVSKEYAGKIIGDTGFAKFGDLNGLYKLNFTFDGVKKTLSIMR